MIQLINLFDVGVENFLIAFRNPTLIKIFYFITWFGDWKVLGILAAVFSVLVFIKKKPQYILPLWVSFLGSAIFVYIGKILIHRPRPLDPLFIEDSFAFPSGHAAMATVFFGFLMFFFCKEWPRSKYKIVIIFLWIIFSLIIGLSRLYLGVHYFSDVFGGYLIGLFWLAIIALISRRRA